MISFASALGVCTFIAMSDATGALLTGAIFLTFLTFQSS
jgi:hypothetical protein